RSSHGTQIHPVLFAGIHEHAGILWQTGTSESRTRGQKLRTDSLVRAECLGNGVHITAYGVTQIRNLVDEAACEWRVSIRGIFNQLVRLVISSKNRAFNQVQRAIEVTTDGQRLCPATTENDPVRPKKILNRGAFT